METQNMLLCSKSHLATTRLPFDRAAMALPPARLLRLTIATALMRGRLVWHPSVAEIQATAQASRLMGTALPVSLTTAASIAAMAGLSM